LEGLFLNTLESAIARLIGQIDDMSHL
jgi:hypothetical protein